jgi:ubiquinone/menaquinone biosynthesis C-methylase UbiE
VTANVSTTEVASLARYEERLEVLVGRCERLVEARLPYLAVVLCHELVRYLYPHEPVAGLTHDDPFPYVMTLVDRLVAVADASLAAIVGYPVGAPVAAADASLEMKTSSLYSDLWKGFDREAMERESLALLRNRVPEEIVEARVRGKRVLDVGCGSGRYTLALAAVGADVTGVDYQPRSFANAVEIARSAGLRATFEQADVLKLPFADGSFDFVFCNGVLHHTASMERGLDEYVRVMRPGGAGFLYLYGSGGAFWHTRRRLRDLFTKIPVEYTQQVFATMGVPGNRFVFCDTWYVPLERHTTRAELEGLLADRGVSFHKLVSKNLIDLDCALARGVKDAEVMWGDGDNRYLVEKPG